MSIDEADALAMEEVEALTEEDLSDAAVDPDAFAGERATILRENAAIRSDLGLDSTDAGDVYSAETGEVLKDAPGWKDGQIQNVDGLDWAGGKLSEVSAVIRENERLRDAAVARLQRQIDLLKVRTMAINSPLVMRQEFFETAIRAYADAHRADILRGLRKDAKSRRFPSGLRLAWKSGGGEYRWRKDMKPAEREAALLAWAQGEVSHRGPDNLIDRKPIAHVENIKNYCEAVYTDALKAFAAARTAGHDPLPPIREAPPGLEYVPEHEELSVKVDQ